MKKTIKYDRCEIVTLIRFVIQYNRCDSVYVTPYISPIFIKNVTDIQSLNVRFLRSVELIENDVDFGYCEFVDDNQNIYKVFNDRVSYGKDIDKYIFYGDDSNYIDIEFYVEELLRAIITIRSCEIDYNYQSKSFKTRRDLYDYCKLFIQRLKSMIV